MKEETLASSSSKGPMLHRYVEYGQTPTRFSSPSPHHHGRPTGEEVTKWHQGKKPLYLKRRMKHVSSVPFATFAKDSYTRRKVSAGSRSRARNSRAATPHSAKQQQKSKPYKMYYSFRPQKYYICRSLSKLRCIYTLKTV
jgi:hypothetical protein